MTILMCIVMTFSSLSTVEDRAIEIATPHDSVLRCECIYYEDIAYVAMITIPLRASDRRTLVYSVEKSLDREGLSHRVMIDDGAYYLIKRTKESQDYEECIKRLNVIYDRRNFNYG